MVAAVTEKVQQIALQPTAITNNLSLALKELAKNENTNNCCLYVNMDKLLNWA